MTHELDTSLNAEVSSSPGNKKIWKTPGVLDLSGRSSEGDKFIHPMEGPGPTWGGGRENGPS